MRPHGCNWMETEWLVGVIETLANPRWANGHHGARRKTGREGKVSVRVGPGCDGVVRIA